MPKKVGEEPKSGGSWIPLRFFENKIRTTAYVQLIHFQHLTHKSDFEIYHERLVINLPRELVGTSNVWRVLQLQYKFPIRS